MSTFYIAASVEKPESTEPGGVSANLSLCTDVYLSAHVHRFLFLLSLKKELHINKACGRN